MVGSFHVMLDGWKRAVAAIREHDGSEAHEESTTFNILRFSSFAFRIYLDGTIAG